MAHHVGKEFQSSLKRNFGHCESSFQRMAKPSPKAHATRRGNRVVFNKKIAPHYRTANSAAYKSRHTPHNTSKEVGFKKDRRLGAALFGSVQSCWFQPAFKAEIAQNWLKFRLSASDLSRLKVGLWRWGNSISPRSCRKGDLDKITSFSNEEVNHYQIVSDGILWGKLAVHTDFSHTSRGQKLSINKQRAKTMHIITVEVLIRHARGIPEWLWERSQLCWVRQSELC